MLKYSIVITFFLIYTSTSSDLSDLVVIILSQKEGYHAAHAELLEREILNQVQHEQLAPPDIVLTHKLNIDAAWTIFPLLPYISSKYVDKKWFLFCTEQTFIKVPQLLKVISNLSTSKSLFIGHSLYDHEPTIIHHFDQHTKKFKYPNIASGFALNIKLVQSLTKRLPKVGEKSGDFTIDVAYEFSKFVDQDNVRLTHIPEMCIVSGSDCATYPRQFHACDTNISNKKIYVAVKTCKKFREDRIPILLRTWVKYVPNIGFYSDETDKTIPNFHIVPNTTQGHCAKTHAILKHADTVLKNQELDWLIIADDDTILGISSLLRLLTCYNPASSVALGERYGFNILSSSEGYNYLTGGAGVVLSAPLVRRMVESSMCLCPSSVIPDDMFLFGVCLARIGVSPTHSSAFHQARPNDYSPGYLSSSDPVSFHKFWMTDPIMIYDHWFKEMDSSLIVHKHTEL